jgi:serine/threonine protein kinase
MEYSRGEIIYNKYLLLEQIAKGLTTSTWIVDDLQINTKVVVKFHFKVIEKHSKIENNIDFLRNIAYRENIVLPINTFEYQNLFCEVFEYFEGGSLDKKISIGTVFSETEIAKLIFQISSALDSLHSHKILHLDIKPHNILIDSEQNYFLSDFSASIQRMNLHPSEIKEGTIFYWAPEYFNRQNISTATDIFSLGCLIFEVCNGFLKNDSKIGYSILMGESKPQLSRSYSKRLEAIIHRCMDVNPSNRFSATELKSIAKHFLDQRYWDSIYSDTTEVGLPPLATSTPIFDSEEIKRIYEKSEIRHTAAVNNIPRSNETFLNRITTGFKKWLKGQKKHQVVNSKEGQILYKIPEKMKVMANNRCLVRIAPLNLIKDDLYKGLEESPYAKHEKIKISGLMSCTLFETGNPQNPNFKIVPLSTQEQEVDFDDYTEWLFDVFPYRKGFFALILKVTRKNYTENNKKVNKDVLVLNREIQVENLIEPSIIEWDSFNQVSWNSDVRKEIQILLSSGETGKCLSIIANILQANDTSVDLFDSIILLQSRWNSSKNSFEQNIIDYQEWSRIVARINQAILSLLSSIDAENKNKITFTPKIGEIKNEIDALTTELQQ